MRVVQRSTPEEEQKIFLKIARYRDGIINASFYSDHVLADHWRGAADEAKNFYRQSLPNQILTHTLLPLTTNVPSVTKVLEEAPKKFLASQKENTTEDRTFINNTYKEAFSEYYYWITQSQLNIFTCLEQNIAQTTAAAEKYHHAHPKAALLAQNATNYFNIAQQHASSSKAETIIHRWKVAGYEAAHLACLYLASTQSNKDDYPELIRYQTESISLAEKSVNLRVKAAQAIQDSHETLAQEYSLAAYAASNASDHKMKLLETTCSGKTQEAAYWKEASLASEQVLKYRLQALEERKNINNKHLEAHWDKVIFYAESAASYRMEALIIYAQHNYLTAKRWTNTAQAATNAMTLWLKTTQHKRYGNAFGVLTAYWHQKARTSEIRVKKAVCKVAMSNITFCLPEQWLPNPEQQKTWPIDQVNFLAAYHEAIPLHTWLYQTYYILKKSGIACSMNADLPNYGIAITIKDAFTVNMTIDSRPSLGMHLHFVMNKTIARFLPGSLLMPPWPPSELLPRNPTRGSRFENICFFGNSNTLAPELLSQEWQQHLLKELGIFCHFRAENSWRDYRDIDCIIAVRDFSRSRHFDKPATKLHYAWLAGVPFIGGTDSAYASDGHQGKDYLAARSAKEVFDHLKRLKEDESFRFKLVKNGFQSSKNFTREAVLVRWKKLLEETLPNLAVGWHFASINKKRWFLIIQRIAYFTDRYLR